MVLTLYRYTEGRLRWYADIKVKDADEALNYLMSIDSSEISWRIREGDLDL